MKSIILVLALLTLGLSCSRIETGEVGVRIGSGYKYPQINENPTTGKTVAMRTCAVIEDTSDSWIKNNKMGCK